MDGSDTGNEQSLGNEAERLTALLERPEASDDADNRDNEERKNPGPGTGVRSGGVPPGHPMRKKTVPASRWIRRNSIS